MSSNLFGQAPVVSVQLAGIQDPVQRVRMTALVKDVLSRHQIEADDQRGVPLQLSFDSDRRPGVERASWTVKLMDDSAQVRQQARFDTTIPADARASVYESSLVAALNANLGSIKSWLQID